METDAENGNGHGKWKNLLLERTKDKPEPPRKSGLWAYTSLGPRATEESLSNTML